jgi:hypothetical protein
MQIVTRLTGTRPLLMHNIHLADPGNYFAKRIAEITKDKKRKATEEGRSEIARLEWMGGIYTEKGRIVIPTANVLKAFNETAKITRKGRDIVRALHTLDTVAPLIYGPKDVENLSIEDLSRREDFRDMTLVGLRGQRVVRCRPIFRVWMLSIEWELETDVLDFDEIAQIVKKAGVVEGLGDNRRNGFGRFVGETFSLDKAEETGAASKKPLKKAA